MSDSPRVRVKEPQRTGQEVRFVLAEDSLAPDHPARLLWTALGDFDLSGFLDGAKAVEGTVGRSVYSPRMMLTLWGYALVQGVIYARELDRRIQTDLAFRWIVGDILVKRSALADFRVRHRNALIDLLADVVGALMHANLLFLPTHHLAQDGTKLRADAAGDSFRTEAGLAVAREQARLHLKAVLAAMDDPPLRKLEQAARERGARDVVARIEAATQEVVKVRRARTESKDKRRQSTEAKASTTDPECRKMRMPDRGYAPAYNVQLATVGDPHGGPVAIVGVQVTTQGNDHNSVMPMLETVAALTGFYPTEVLADPDHVTLATLREAAQRGVRIVSRVPEPWDPASPAHDATTRAWMAQTDEPATKDLYRARKVLAERPNAVIKATMGLRRLPVRGEARVECLALLLAIVLNVREHRAHWVN